jgi:hypothetical protein
MENNQKPEWFELADNDQPENRPLRSRLAAPKRNLALILAFVLVLPTGAGFALLSKDDESASAAETVNLTQDAQSTANTSPAQSSMAITMPTGASDDDEEADD